MNSNCEKCVVTLAWQIYERLLSAGLKNEFRTWALTVGIICDVLADKYGCDNICFYHSADGKTSTKFVVTDEAKNCEFVAEGTAMMPKFDGE